MCYLKKIKEDNTFQDSQVCGSFILQGGMLMHEIKIKVNGNGTLTTGFVDRLKLGTANEVNRVKMIFNVDESVEGTFRYIKFLKGDISFIYRIHNDEAVINKTIFANSGIWLFSFISTDAPISNRQITGTYAFITEPIEVVVVDGILEKGNLPQDAILVKELIEMKIGSLILPDYIEEIGDYFMYDAEANLYLELNEGIKSMGTYAFYGCTIGGFLYPKNCQLETMKDYSFYNVYFENELILPASIKSWGKYVLKNSDVLSITFQKDCKLESMGSYALWENSACEIYLPDNLKTLSGNTYVIKNCKNLYYLSIPNTITTPIPANAIFGCDALDEIDLEEEFNASANFSNCTALTRESMIKMFEALKDLTDTSAKSLTLGSTNLAKLTNDDKAIAINKNWTLS